MVPSMSCAFGSLRERSRREWLLCGGALITTGLAGCRASRADARVLVAAASSTRELFETCAPGFDPTALDFSFDASSTLARQIRAGAEFDVFVSADERSLLRVEGWGRGEYRAFLGNRLALVARADKAAGISHPRDLLGEPLNREGAIALGAPEVPAGRYARAWLTGNGLDALASRFVYGRNARAVLGLVEAGAAEYAFVYRSEANRAARVRCVWTAGPLEEPRIRYRVGVARSARNEAAWSFADWLVAGGADRTGLALGFSTLEG
ncbi:MAG: molybdate ABC transporter substrate-binding protein [Planctomycetes bacterium]|nr:molybdate ABC transporter substrate-binding protein [Planctomycetota bacterium]